MARIGGLVLAAGASRRMGRPKLLLPFAEQPLIRQVVMRVLATDLDPVVVVVPDPDPGLRGALSELPVMVVENGDAGGPTSTSIHLGLAALPTDLFGVVILLADMPHVTAEMMQGVAAIGRDGAGPVVVSRYGDVAAPPLFFHRALFPELMAWHGDGCGKEIARRHREAAQFVGWDPAFLRDLDTPADYEFLLSDVKRAPPLAPRHEVP